jgi:ATP-dependent RNA helicase RhlE
VPTRELAIQVHSALATYGAPAGLKAVAIFGGVPMGAQVKALHRGADIIVATPGRLLDHMQQRTAHLSSVEILVLDEADRMLDMGYLPPLRRILSAVPKERQTLLLSATFSKEIVSLSAEFTRQPVRVDVSDAQVVATTVTHRMHPVADARKGALLTHVLTQPPAGQALVFCRTKRGSNRVGEALERAGVRAAVIHGNKSQGARNRALGDFKAGRVTTLAATDLAARGLDIVQLPLVVNYDLPLVAEDYIHRVGRTGRAGLAGHAVSLVSVSDRSLLHAIQRLLPSPIEQVEIAGFEPGPSDKATREEPGRRFQPSRPRRDAGRPGRGTPRPASRTGPRTTPRATLHGSGRRPAMHGGRSRSRP